MDIVTGKKILSVRWKNVRLPNTTEHGINCILPQGKRRTAERNAIANMITNGENQIIKIVAVMSDGKAGMPCGACREFMMQLDKTSGEIEILRDYETKKVIRLKSLTPEWWSTDKMEMSE